MAKTPKTGSVQWGVVKPSNETGPGGNRASNGYLSLAGSPGPIPSTGLSGGDRRNGSSSLGGMISPVHPPANRFDVEKAKMPQPPSATEPGKGSIPVNPWNDSGRPNHASPGPEVPRESHQ
jgi:hypothetical protein